MGHIGMKYSLVTRDLIADSTEAMAMAHQFDGLVMVPNCDKNVPGLLMAAARINVPTIFVSGGPMMAGHVHGEKQVFPVCLKQLALMRQERWTMKDFWRWKTRHVPHADPVQDVYSKQHELSDRGSRNGTCRKRNDSGSLFRAYPSCKTCRNADHGIGKKNICPRDIMTKEAILNALTVDMALGCSTNSMLHLPAIAHEIGMDFEIDFANGISEKTPNLCHLAPAGHTYIEDLNEAGGVYAVMSELNKRTSPYGVYDCNRKDSWRKHQRSGEQKS